MAAIATGERLALASPRPRRSAAGRSERAHDARVDLGCLPRLLGYNLRRAQLCTWRKYAAQFGENNIRPGLFSLLVLVGSNPGIAQIELGKHLGIDKASIVALLHRLEKVGLLDRRPSTRHRPRPGIFLTARGATELAALIAQVRALERQMAGRFTRAEFEQFLGFLQRLYS